MQRFWRVALVLLVSATLGFFCSMGAVYVAAPFAPGFYMEYLLFGGVAFSVFSSAALALLMRGCIRTCQDGETRCRKCGYILRGISEPRCPECGESI